MKTKEELNALKDEADALTVKLTALSEEQLQQVAGGNLGKAGGSEMGQLHTLMIRALDWFETIRGSDFYYILNSRIRAYGYGGLEDFRQDLCGLYAAGEYKEYLEYFFWRFYLPLTNDKIYYSYIYQYDNVLSDMFYNLYRAAARACDAVGFDRFFWYEQYFNR